MDVFRSVTAARSVLILGILTFFAVLLIYLSCRCVSASRVGARLMKQQWYKRFFGKHCYLWGVFGVLVVAHAFLAIMFLGWPR